MSKEISMSAIVRLAVEPAWLAKPREDRRAVAGRVADILAAHPAVETTWFDADALGSGYSDFVICKFSNIAAYHFLWEELKDSELFTAPFMNIVDVTLGIERGHEAYEAQLGG